MPLNPTARQRIWVTGQRGYLGQCLAVLIQADPALELVSTDQRLQTLEAGSIHCDVVIHTACHRDPRGSSSAADFTDNNENATRTLMAALAEITPILYTSTHGVYGTAPAYTENANPQPTSLHGQSKWRTEQLLQTGPHPVQIVRLTDLWGPGVGRLGRTFLDQCLAKARQQESITLFEIPTLRDHLYVWDAARWLLHMLNNPLSVGVLNLAAPAFCLQERVRAACAGAPHPVSLVMSQQPPTHPPLMDTSLWQSLQQDFALTPVESIFKTIWEQAHHHDTL
ncbi:MAG: NAD-dependent epimerase/dehydratase family protein [Candidatus Sericytochromatia bacterium]